MALNWFRTWTVTAWQDSGHFDYLTLGALDPQHTHLRTYVSCYIESWGIFTVTEPLFIGVYALQSADTTPPPPPDPAVDGLPGDWWRGETHYGQLVSSDPTNPVQRAVWPAGGSLLWDIETNRRPLAGDNIVYWLVWAGPRDVQLPMRAVVYKATLQDDHGLV